jgi:acetylornithine deacetylase/succinyl-diaminopimelate desuccinylase-like protein
LQHRARSIWTAAAFCALCGPAGRAAPLQSSAVTRETAHDIFKQLIEIDTTDSIGSVTPAAPAMAKRLIDVDRDDLRMHGKVERLKAESFYTGVEFYYEFLKTLTGGRS